MFQVLFFCFFWGPAFRLGTLNFGPFFLLLIRFSDCGVFLVGLRFDHRNTDQSGQVQISNLRKELSLHSYSFRMGLEPRKFPPSIGRGFLRILRDRSLPLNIPD